MFLSLLTRILSAKLIGSAINSSTKGNRCSSVVSHPPFLQPFFNMIPNSGCQGQGSLYLFLQNSVTALGHSTVVITSSTTNVPTPALGHSPARGTGARRAFVNVEHLHVTYNPMRNVTLSTEIVKRPWLLHLQPQACRHLPTTTPSSRLPTLTPSPSAVSLAIHLRLPTTWPCSAPSWQPSPLWSNVSNSSTNSTNNSVPWRLCSRVDPLACLQA